MLMNIDFIFHFIFRNTNSPAFLLLGGQARPLVCPLLMSLKGFFPSGHHDYKSLAVKGSACLLTSAGSKGSFLGSTGQV